MTGLLLTTLCLGRPTIVGNTTLGASSPEKPAFRVDDPGSITIDCISDSDIVLTFVSPSAFSRRAVVSYWRKYVHEVLVNRLRGLSLPRKSVVRLTDRPDMTLDVKQQYILTLSSFNWLLFDRPSFVSNKYPSSL